MPASDYYWSRRLIRGFGKMWFLIIPREADSSGSGASLLGSVVNELDGGFFPSSGGLIGKDFPEPNHLTTPQLLLKAIESRRSELELEDNVPIVVEDKFPGLTTFFERNDTFKVGNSLFPSVPISLNVDYSRMERISIEFGNGTRKLMIPTGFLSRLKDFVDGDDRKLTSDVSIDKETIVHQILLTKQYSVTFESKSTFDTNFETQIRQLGLNNAGKIKFALEQTTKKKITISVDNGKEYLIALKDIDWDDL